MLTFQKTDGRFEILPHYSKENGIVLWTCVRHAMLTQDKEWLRVDLAEVGKDRRLSSNTCGRRAIKTSRP